VGVSLGGCRHTAWRHWKVPEESPILVEGKAALSTGSVCDTGGIHRPALTYHGYTAAKTAILGFTHNLAIEVGQYNITVHIVSPGLTLTAEVRTRLSPEEQERRAPQIPLRRLGTVEDTANVVLFLASELGSFVTGLYISVCGGQVME
jgi:NAD(P)-dependent dehydrogenase (short-subunit alcohol dehydrogenase family)